MIWKRFGFDSDNNLDYAHRTVKRPLIQSFHFSNIFSNKKHYNCCKDKFLQSTIPMITIYHFFLTRMSPIKPLGLTLETKTIPLCPLYDFRAEIWREHLPHPPLGNITFEEEPDLIENHQYISQTLEKLMCCRE